MSTIHPGYLGAIGGKRETRSTTIKVKANIGICKSKWINSCIGVNREKNNENCKLFIIQQVCSYGIEGAIMLIDVFIVATKLIFLHICLLGVVFTSR